MTAPLAGPAISIFDTTVQPSAAVAAVPAMRDSGIPLETVLMAVGVVTVVACVLWAHHRGNKARPEHPHDKRAGSAAAALSGSGVSAASAGPGKTDVLAFLVALGEAMIDSGDPVTHVRSTLTKVAEVNGVEGTEIIVLATALIVSVPGEGAVQTAVATAGHNPLRLDQIDEVFTIVGAAERGDIGPQEGLQRIHAARTMAPSFRPAHRALGYIVLTLGLALLLRASLPDLLIAGLLGAAIGVLQVRADRLTPTTRVLLPVLCAFGVSATVFALARTGLDIGGLPALVAPLVTFLPGALLTTAVIELSTGQMISGAGRLAAGGMQLVLLALGILAGAQLVGGSGDNLAEVASQPLGPFAPWLGVAIFGVGAAVFYCARPSSTGWIILVLYIAYAGQVIGGLFFGGILSAFFGALVMTPVAMFAATQQSGPPTLVSFLPAFWLLIPGALGLVGVAKYLGDERIDGAASLVTAGATMVGIALGVLVGLAVGYRLEALFGTHPGARAARA
jgi:uncharacterized membrane protein YjjP (DUF1212 family)